MGYFQMHKTRPLPRRRGRRNGAMGDDDFSALLAAGFDQFLDTTKQIAGQAEDPAITDIDSSGPLIASVPSWNMSIPGICKPGDKNTLFLVTGFQKQLNRVAEVKGIAKIGVDGDLGPRTLALFRQVQSLAGGTISGDGSSCAGLAETLPQIGVQVASFADSLGAPARTSSPPAPTPTFVSQATGQEVKVPQAGASVSDMFMGMSTTMKVAFVGILGGIGYFAYQALGKPARATSSRGRTRRRR